MVGPKKSAAIIAATLLVAVTPLFAYADAVPKTESTAKDDAIVSAADKLLGSAIDDANHGGVVSAANQDYENLLKDTALLNDLKAEGRKLTRGLLISIIARSDLGKGNKGHDSDADENSDKHESGDEDTGSGHGKGNHGKPNNPSVTTNSESTPVPTATTAASTETPTPTATAVPTAGATETATPEPTSATHGRSGGAPGRQ